MEYSNPNISYITYIQNITPLAFIETFEELEHIEGFGICERFGTDAITLFATATAYVANASQTAHAAYTAYASIVSQTAHAAHAYLAPYAVHAYLIPLALLALLTLITLLITYKDTQYIEEEESEDESIELSDESHTEDEPESEDESEDEPEDIDFTSSTIEGCIIVNKEGDIVSDNKSFRGILIDIWKTMEKEEIKETSTFTFKSGNKRGLKGYNWCEAINMSFQNKDSNKSLNEIRKMVEVNNLTIDMSIKLRTGEIVHID
jgi:nitrogen fixation-related uncharacterized protein